MDLPDCFRVEEIAPHSINGIRWISNHSPSLENPHNPSDQSQLRIFRIDGDDHDSLSFVEISVEVEVKAKG
jgi:hypothetical protein